ncbi:MAG: DUF948 domain-containing protein [bacterium]|nr:DUF948 domain-containing protein [bacterium]
MPDKIMSSIMQSQIFFFISSVGFIILGILVAIILIYILRALNLFSRILKRMEKDIDSVGAATKETIDAILESSVFRFLFQDKRKRKEL